MHLPHRYQEPTAGSFLPRDAFVQAVRGRPVVIHQGQERDFHGPLINLVAYMFLAAVFVVLVIEHAWTDRFLIATAFFLAIGAMALMDIVRSNRVTYYRVDTTDHGEMLSYITPSLDDARQVAADIR